MLKQSIVAFDTTITARIRRWPTWLDPFMRAATTIGQPVVLVAGATLFIVQNWQSQPRLAASMIAGLAAMVVCALLKHFIHRTRPDTLYVSRMYFKSASFPSGHAFGAAVIFGLLAYLAAHYTPPWQYIACSFLGILIISIGVSRIYLGAHYPSDVLAGWILGGLTVVAIVISVGL